MARNDILQILVFSILFGVVLSAIKTDPRVAPLIAGVDALVPAMLMPNPASQPISALAARAVLFGSSYRTDMTYLP